MTTGVWLLVALACVLIGVGLWLLAQQRERKYMKGAVQIVQPNNLPGLDAKLHALLKENPSLPALPRLSEEYEGWFQEVLKRIGHASLHQTRERELQLIRQVNTLYEEYKRYVETALGIQKASLELTANTRLRRLREKHEVETLMLGIEEKKDKRKQIKEDAARRNASPVRQNKENAQEKFFGRLKQLKDERKRRLAECEGDSDCEGTVNRYFDDLEEKLKEGR